MKFKVTRYGQIQLSAEVEAESKEEAEQLGWTEDTLTWFVDREEIDEVTVVEILWQNAPRDERLA
jgi:hypothetical protein